MLLRLALIAVIAVAAAVGTPTAVFPQNVTGLPWYWLMENQNTGALTVVGPYPSPPPIPFGTQLVARARYNASVEAVGWSYFEAAPLIGGKWAAYNVGYLEGAVTHETLSYTNFSALVPTNPSVLQWIRMHLDYMQKNADAAEADPTVFQAQQWRQIGRVLSQIVGLTEGFNAASGRNVTVLEMFLLSFSDELMDVYTAVKVQSDPKKAAARNVPSQWVKEQRTSAKASHCSALIRVTADDLYSAQVTWDSLTAMARRIYKVFRLGVEGDGTATVALSSFPGVVASGDDWYMTSNELAVQETSNEVWNTSLYTAVVPSTVSEFIRVMAANYLATSGDAWTSMFAFNNSGTYNNQYMVTDFTRFQPGAPTLTPGTLWVAEQIPGYVARADVTVVLDQQGYWASYNWAYFKYIYDVSGYAQMEAEYGSFFSYTKYARPEIFKRNHTMVTDLATMQRMMRYNNFQHDPLSLIPNCTGTPGGKCSPPYSAMLAIASRGDLNPPDATSHYGPLEEYVGRITNFGAIDCKIAAWSNRKSLTGIALSGPTNDQQPTFAWSTSPFPDLRPAGSVDVYDFPWVSFTPAA